MLRPHPPPLEPPALGAHPITRRGFLRRSAAAAVCLAGAGLLQAGCGEEALPLPPGEHPLVLGPADYGVLRALCARLVPGGPNHPGAVDLRVPLRVDRELSFHGERLRSDVRDALRLIEWGALLTRLQRFSRLDARAQDAELEALARSRLAVRRTAFQGVKFLVMFFHYTQDPAWAGIGYDGPWVARRAPAALA